MGIIRGMIDVKEPQPDDNPWRGFFIVSALGADLVFCLVVGYFVGHYLGGKFGHAMAWTVGGAFVGLAAGIISVIVLLKSITEGNNG